jgi:UDP-2,3-diacylglucosamine hydrolase
MKPVYLISDVHAGIRGDGLDAAKLEAFALVLEKARREASEVVLLGDIFDFWFEWKDVIPSRHLPWLNVLKNVADSGLPMSIFPGNHDFKLGGVLESTIGLRLPGDLERREVLGSQVLLPAAEKRAAQPLGAVGIRPAAPGSGHAAGGLGRCGRS